MSTTVEAVFRREWGRAVAVVARLTGDLGLAEDAVQDPFAVALGRWAGGDLPSDPAGWLITVAKNQALDRLRREARRSGKEAAAVRLLRQHEAPPPPTAVPDDRLRLMFACCHPALDPGIQAALTLRILCGLTGRTCCGGWDATAKPPMPTAPRSRSGRPRPNENSSPPGWPR